MTIFLQNNHGISVKSRMAAINLHIQRDKLWYFVYGLIIQLYMTIIKVRTSMELNFGKKNVF